MEYLRNFLKLGRLLHHERRAGKKDSLKYEWSAIMIEYDRNDA